MWQPIETLETAPDDKLLWGWTERNQPWVGEKYHSGAKWDALIDARTGRWKRCTHWMIPIPPNPTEERP